MRKICSDNRGHFTNDRGVVKFRKVEIKPL